MKLSHFLVLAAGHLAQVLAMNLPPNHPPVPWKPAGPNDMRAPCPMLNTLANHGYLPHDGKNISEKRVIYALGTALNIDEELSQFLFKEALTTNPDQNATTFSLDNLNRHNILEHDASLSRQDFYFGNDHIFNQTIFDQTRSYWTDPFTIDVQAAARARQARVDTSNATNPTFQLSSLGTGFSFGESAAYIIVLGNKTTGVVNKSWVEYLFENERLPLELGWTKHREAISHSDLDNVLDRIKAATPSAAGIDMEMVKRNDLHWGGNSRLGV